MGRTRLLKHYSIIWAPIRKQSGLARGIWGFRHMSRTTNILSYKTCSPGSESFSGNLCFKIHSCADLENVKITQMQKCTGGVQTCCGWKRNVKVDCSVCWQRLCCLLRSNLLWSEKHSISTRMSWLSVSFTSYWQRLYGQPVPTITFHRLWAWLFLFIREFSLTLLR